MPEQQHRLGLYWTCRAHLGSGSRHAPHTFLKEALLHHLRKPLLAGQLRLLDSSLTAQLPESVCPGGFNYRCHGPTLRTASCRPHSQVTHNKMLSDIKSLLTGNLACNKPNAAEAATNSALHSVCIRSSSSQRRRSGSLPVAVCTKAQEMVLVRCGACGLFLSYGQSACQLGRADSARAHSRPGRARGPLPFCMGFGARPHGNPGTRSGPAPGLADK